jgi:calcineurin-like phosphoesterase family protein
VIWLTADNHFGHTNILTYCSRLFVNVDEMDEALIESWNKYIKPDDTVYHLGDFTLGGAKAAERLFLRLNGIIHVLGYRWHHDKRWIDKQFYLSAKHYPVIIEPPIVVLEDVEQVNDRSVPAILCHYAFEIWDRRHYGSFHFHGHSHGMLKNLYKRLDIGVDSAFQLVGEYRPLSLEEAITFAKNICSNCQ